MSNTPTDAELKKLAEECGIGWGAGLGGMDDFLRAFACAVLAKWGTPQPSDCTRSHPHEDMSDYCLLRTEIARLANENARLKASQPVVREPSEAEIVFAAISSGEWTVTRNQPSCYLTDEGNARNAWSVQRAVAPYCADLGPGKGWGNRGWNGPTALAALKAASKEIGIPLPITQKGGSNAE